MSSLQLFFAFQIYCDFAGYCYIAIGCAALFGIRLTDNFRQPYFSRSIREFWRRWHITLGSWFRDYMYFPLGGNRAGPLRHAAILMLVFLASGLWHGANWTFLLWGALHGVYIVAELTLKARLTPSLNRAGFDLTAATLRMARVLVTFHLVCFAWLFFRARSIEEAVQLIKNAAALEKSEIVFTGGLSAGELALSAVLIGALIVFERFQQRAAIFDWFMAQPLWIRWSACATAIYAVLLLPGSPDLAQFIYFRF